MTTAVYSIDEELLAELDDLQLWEVEPVEINNRPAADPKRIPRPPCRVAVRFTFDRPVTVNGLRVLVNGAPYPEQPWIPWDSQPVSFIPWDSLQVTIVITRKEDHEG